MANNLDTIPETIREDVESLQNILQDYKVSAIYPDDPMDFLSTIRTVDPEFFAAIDTGLIKAFEITNVELAEMSLAFVYPTHKSLSTALILKMDVVHTKLRQLGKKGRQSILGWDIDMSMDQAPVPTYNLVVNLKSPKGNGRYTTSATLGQGIDLHEVGAAAAVIRLLVTDKIYRSKFLNLKMTERARSIKSLKSRPLLGRMVSSVLKMHPYDLTCLLVLDYRKISRQPTLLKNYYILADGEWFIYDGKVEETVVGAAAGIAAKFAKWVKYGPADQLDRGQRLTAFMLSELNDSGKWD